MREAIIIGGGLSGLCAAAELQKYGVSATLIEVKHRFGGSIVTTQQDGFIIDGGPFAVRLNTEDPLIVDTGLRDELYPLSADEWAFTRGTQSLVDALSRKIDPNVLMRMAVSSIGTLDDRLCVCLENGTILNSAALIIAAPARFVERMFYGYIDPISEALRDYHYDTIIRLSLGYQQGQIPENPMMPPDMAYAFIKTTIQSSRVPEGGILAQVGLRFDPARVNQESLVEHVLRDLKWPAPLVQQIDYWPEADPLSCYDDHHQERMAQIRALLPDGIALIGSDYCEDGPAQRGITRLDDRIRLACSAGQQIARHLGKL